MTTLKQDDFNPNTPNKDGKTPLSIAAWKGEEGVVKMFLERLDVGSNTADKCGETLLFWAAHEGHSPSLANCKSPPSSTSTISHKLPYHRSELSKTAVTKRCQNLHLTRSILESQSPD